MADSSSPQQSAAMDTTPPLNNLTDATFSVETPTTPLRPKPPVRPPRRAVQQQTASSSRSSSSQNDAAPQDNDGSRPSSSGQASSQAHVVALPPFGMMGDMGNVPPLNVREVRDTRPIDQLALSKHHDELEDLMTEDTDDKCSIDSTGTFHSTYSRDANQNTQTLPTGTDSLGSGSEARSRRMMRTQADATEDMSLASLQKSFQETSREINSLVGDSSVSISLPSIRIRTESVSSSIHSRRGNAGPSAIDGRRPSTTSASGEEEEEEEEEVAEYVPPSPAIPQEPSGGTEERTPSEKDTEGESETRMPQSSTSQSSLSATISPSGSMTSPRLSWGANFWCVIDQGTGRKWFANPHTGDCRWSIPKGAYVLPPNPGGQWWELYDEQKRLPYFFQTKTQKTQWERPEGFVVPMAAIQQSTLGKRFSITELEGQVMAQLDNMLSGEDGESKAETPHTTSYSTLNAGSSPPPEADTYPPMGNERHAPLRLPTSQEMPEPETHSASQSSPVSRSLSRDESIQSQITDLTSVSASHNEKEEEKEQQKQDQTTAVFQTSPRRRNDVLIPVEEETVDTLPPPIKVTSETTTKVGKNHASSSKTVECLDLAAKATDRLSPTPSPRSPTPDSSLINRQRSVPALRTSALASPTLPSPNSPSGRLSALSSPKSPSGRASALSSPRSPNGRASALSSPRSPSGRISAMSGSRRGEGLSLQAFASQYFAKTRGGILRRRTDTDTLSRWQPSSISAPLLPISDADLRRDAIRCFKILQRACGDRSNPVFWPRVPSVPSVDTTEMDTHGDVSFDSKGCGGDFRRILGGEVAKSQGKTAAKMNTILNGTDLAGPSAIEEITWLIARVQIAPVLRDEVFVQTMKQLTRTARELSEVRGWGFMATLLTFGHPSAKLEPYLHNMLVARRASCAGKAVHHDHEEEDDDYLIADYCVHRMAHMAKHGSPRPRNISTEDILHAQRAPFFPRVFGQSLEMMMTQQSKVYPKTPVPIILIFLTKSLLSLDAHLTPGVFRATGSLQYVEKLRMRMDQGAYSLKGLFERDASDKPDNSPISPIPSQASLSAEDKARLQSEKVAVLATTLKTWLRELEHPLIPASLRGPCLSSAQNTEGALQSCMLLPAVHKRALIYLVAFLRVFCAPPVVAYTGVDVGAIAQVFAPNIFQGGGAASLVMPHQDVRAERQFLETLLRHVPLAQLDPNFSPRFDELVNYGGGGGNSSRDSSGDQATPTIPMVA